MVAIPKRETTLKKIDKIEYGGNPRKYLGMSGIGASCGRSLWYGFHWVTSKKTPARIQRIFDIGHMFEQLAIKDLKKVGIEVYRKDHDEDGNEIKVEMTGHPDEKQETIPGFAGHSEGHPDGRCIGLIEAPKTEHLLEMKTMNDKYFKSVCKSGVQKAFPVYYGQAQRYMKGMKVTRTLFVAINKNDCTYYFERINFDKNFAEDLVRKEQQIIMSDAPPPKAFPRGYFECNWKSCNSVCHEWGEPNKNCRTCDYCDAGNNGTWTCNNEKRIYDLGCKAEEINLSVEDQRAGCEYWKIGWGLEDNGRAEIEQS